MSSIRNSRVKKMGVCCIVQWAYPESLNTSQALETLQRRIELLGATNLGNWSVDCEVLQSATPISGSQNKFIYFIHSTEYPRTTFTVVDPPYVCLVADNTLDTIFTHLKQSYVPRKQLKVEAKGLRYEVRGKYIVKFGSVTFSNTSKSIIVETEDVEESTASTAWDQLVELTKSLLHTSVHIPTPEHVQKALDGRYAPADSMVQYAQIFQQIRKAGSAK